ncbi:Salicylaldehyde dehydrogenase [Vanrija pseudolonga]|uniref:Salicylaldehyde dehydrogenase n=1 Tax=Vanrija pseudolonga TaxID=143232 RepID=A0AAF0Y7N9_9TREE|nr:Salicylaldehyde dehydrogenase [Vanrija pseudolonga]
MAQTAVRNLIHGHQPAHFTTYDVVHPQHGLVHAVERSTETDVFAAIGAAHRASLSWRQTSLAERTEIVRKAADLLADDGSGWRRRIDDANEAETPVSPKWLGVFDVPAFMRGLADVAERALADEEVKANGCRTASASPWRRGMRWVASLDVAKLTYQATILMMRATVTPLLAGNTVVFKTSETTPYTQTLVAQLLHEAGVPKDALVVLHVAVEDAPKLVQVLISDKRVRHVNFTGSTRVGSIIARTAGEHLKPAIVELGGKAPLVLLPDADLDVAASNIIAGALLNAGQICMSTEKVIVPATMYPALVVALREEWSSYEGKAARGVASATSGDRIKKLVTDALDKGAKNILPFPSSAASLPPGKVYPSILGGVTRKMRLYTEESFGPTLAIVAVPDEGRRETSVIHDLVQIANDTEYGLSAAVWGKDVARARAVARGIDAGAVHINTMTPGDSPLVPHGGCKSSGWGRFNGVEGLRAFTQVRESHPHTLTTRYAALKSRMQARSASRCTCLISRLRALFPPSLPITIEHVGSTSVPGLAAKPILDIDIVVAASDLAQGISVLKAAGYEHRGDQGVPSREAFRLPAAPAASGPRVNLYLCVDGVLALRNHLAVRDVLRADDALRDEYAATKYRLASTQGIDMDSYVEGKSEVLGRILAKGGIGAAELAQIEEVNRDTR